jgi:hypothetical protein
VVVLCEEGSSLYWNGILNTTGILPDATPSTGYANKAFGDAALDEFTFVADVNGDGYADRIVVRRHDEGWNWLCDYSNSEGFGDSSVDSSYVGANNSTDIPMVDDINGDGYADIVIARRENGVLKWYANLSSSSGFGGKWIWGPSVFGGSNDIPVIGHFTHYSTTESVCGDLGYPVGDIGGPGGEGIRDCKVDFYDLMVFVSHWLTGAGNQN